MQMVNAPDTYVEDEIQIWWRTNLFHETGNREYARMEAKSGVSLVVVSVRNRGLTPLMLPDDLAFENENGDPIWPLSLEEALNALIVPVSFEEQAVEVDSGLWRLGRSANQAIKIKSRLDFVNEIYEWYLVDRTVNTGHLQTGVIVVPVPASTKWRLQLHERK